MRWLKHAFAVGTPASDPPPEQLAVAEQLCQEVVRRGMSTPALAFLEMSRPLNYLGAQALHFLAPFLEAILSGPEHRQLAEFLERRDASERLCRRIQELEQQATRQATDPGSGIHRDDASD